MPCLFYWVLALNLGLKYMFGNKPNMSEHKKNGKKAVTFYSATVLSACVFYLAAFVI